MKSAEFVINGMPVWESITATETVANKLHRYRRWMRGAYHRRIMKKWRKRYGTHEKPAAFVLNGKIILMHPDLVKVMRTKVPDVRGIFS